MKRLTVARAGAMMAASAFAASTPTYPGGDEAMQAYIAENLRYPQTAKEHGIEGVISLTIAIKPDGTIGTIKVDRLVDNDLEQEAIRLVKNMPAWKPAEENGTPVGGTAHVSIPFVLE